MGLITKDRLYLVNVQMILELLDQESKHPSSELISSLENGFEIIYSYIHDQISWEIPQVEGHFVYDVLSIYRSIESYKRDNLADDIACHAWGYFHGYERNHESEYRAFALFLIETQKKFKELLEYKDRTDSFNMNAQTLAKYINMVNEWNKLGKDLNTLENILRVLDA